MCEEKKIVKPERGIVKKSDGDEMERGQRENERER